jgi:hypothetical protein
MKTILSLLGGVSILSFATHGQAATPAPGGSLADSVSSAPASCFVQERGPHHRVWSRVSWITDRRGQTVAVTNAAYTELTTGLHWHPTAGRSQP